MGLEWIKAISLYKMWKEVMQVNTKRVCTSEESNPECNQAHLHDIIIIIIIIAGYYSCHASNSEGSGTSNVVSLIVQCKS